jgi:hypothetical protein
MKKRSVSLILTLSLACYGLISPSNKLYARCKSIRQYSFFRLAKMSSPHYRMQELIFAAHDYLKEAEDASPLSLRILKSPLPTAQAIHLETFAQYIDLADQWDLICNPQDPTKLNSDWSLFMQSPDVFKLLQELVQQKLKGWQEEEKQWEKILKSTWTVNQHASEHLQELQLEQEERERLKNEYTSFELQNQISELETEKNLKLKELSQKHHHLYKKEHASPPVPAALLVRDKATIRREKENYLALKGQILTASEKLDQLASASFTSSAHSSFLTQTAKKFQALQIETNKLEDDFSKNKKQIESKWDPTINHPVYQNEKNLYQYQKNSQLWREMAVFHRQQETLQQEYLQLKKILTDHWENPARKEMIQTVLSFETRSSPHQLITPQMANLQEQIKLAASIPELQPNLVNLEEGVSHISQQITTLNPRHFSQLKEAIAKVQVLDQAWKNQQDEIARPLSAIKKIFADWEEEQPLLLNQLAQTLEQQQQQQDSEKLALQNLSNSQCQQAALLAPLKQALGHFPLQLKKWWKNAAIFSALTNGTVASEESCPICHEGQGALMENTECLHRHCEDCLNQYLRTQYADKMQIPKCPDSACSAHLKLPSSAITKSQAIDSHILYLLHRQSLSLWAQSQPERFIACSNSKCPAFFDKSAKSAYRLSPTTYTGTKFKCPCCQSVTCLRCQTEQCAKTHVFGNDCSSQISNVEEAENRNRAAGLRPCPQCKTWIEKNQGCDHMTCTSCKFEFSMLTGRPWREIVHAAQL